MLKYLKALPLGRASDASSTGLGDGRPSARARPPGISFRGRRWERVGTAAFGGTWVGERTAMVASTEFIENLLEVLETATRQNYQTPGREGNILVLTPDMASDVMITADLHGHRRNFNQIKKIADLDKNPKRHLVLQEVCHGGPTYPSNGGCMSHGMLEDVAKLKVKYPERVHFMMSNHELSELTEYPILKTGKMLNLMFRLGIAEMYGGASEKIREGYLNFIRSLPLAIRLPGDILLTHSAPEKVDAKGFDNTVFDRELTPADLKEGTDVFQMVWGRDYRQENAEAFAKIVGAKVLIHGHTPCEKGFNVPNSIQIILDCCSRPASYVIIPAKEGLTQKDVVDRIKML